MKKKKNFHSEKESDIDCVEVAHPFISHYITAAVATIKQSWQPSLTGPSKPKVSSDLGRCVSYGFAVISRGVSDFCKNVFPGGFGLYFKAAITRKMEK